MRRIRIRPKARRELLSTFRNLLESSGAKKAAQFQSSAWQTFLDLARMPMIGAPRKLERSPHLWRIREFEEYLVFYSVEPESIGIQRVIHAKLDYRRQFS